PASRLLYDAKLGSGAAPSGAGTLAVVYDGKVIVTASLTGPFGSHIAEHRDGAVTGGGRAAFCLHPLELRPVPAGTRNDVGVACGAWGEPAAGRARVFRGGGPARDGGEGGARDRERRRGRRASRVAGPDRTPGSARRRLCGRGPSVAGEGLDP